MLMHLTLITSQPLDEGGGRRDKKGSRSSRSMREGRKEHDNIPRFSKVRRHYWYRPYYRQQKLKSRRSRKSSCTQANLLLSSHHPQHTFRTSFIAVHIAISAMEKHARVFVSWATCFYPEHHTPYHAYPKRITHAEDN